MGSRIDKYLPSYQMVYELYLKFLEKERVLDEKRAAYIAKEYYIEKIFSTPGVMYSKDRIRKIIMYMLKNG